MTQMTLEQAIELAMRRHQAGDLQQAESLYRQILKFQPDHPDALHMLGLLALGAGKFDEALQLIERAIQVHPVQTGYYSNRGQVLAAMGRTEDAIAAYRHALSLEPNLLEASNNLGNLLRDRGELQEAVVCYRRAIALRPDVAPLWLNLATTLHAAGQFAQAVEAYQQHLRLQPDNPDALNNLGNLLQDMAQLQPAVEMYRKALSLRPIFPEAHHNLGKALLKMEQFDLAMRQFTEAVSQRPDYGEAYGGLGNSLRLSGRIEEAVVAHRKAVSLRPDSADAHVDLGYSLHQATAWPESQAEFLRAIELNPDCAMGHYNLGLSRLLHGDFAQGWIEHEWRWRVDQYAPLAPRYSKPQWDGSRVEGQHLLLHAEQGFGDAIQFARYIPLAARRAASITVVCPAELRRLLQMVSGAQQVIAPFDPTPQFDAYCPLLSLPVAFKTTLESIPARVPYLSASPDSVSQWRRRMDEDHRRLKVGLVWAGRPTHRNDRNRSLSLELLKPLAEVREVRFFNLQKGDASKRAAGTSFELTDWTSELEDFADTAALVENLDLVIAADTAVAHLAGGLGKPVWVLLPFVPDWRWLLDRDDSPWYPTMRLFRQTIRGDWHEPIRRVVTALKEFSRP